ncbi:MAG: hypothetical protein EPO08_08125 [Rhodospirillaceae bacterium]|nr:MAG: hypothetical protein EPO08_08125 [Rhodospirillaceae bacterium]
MQTITHYEVYEAGSGQWALAARFSGSESQSAMARARAIEENAQRPVAVIEEIENLTSTQFDVRLIHRSMLGGVAVRPPSSQSDIGSRIFMVILTGIAIGAVVAVIVATVLSNAGGGAGGIGGFLKTFVLGSFLMGAILGGGLIFRLYVPVGLILWNSKDPESRKRTIQTLAHGTVVSPASETESTTDLGRSDPDPAPIRSGDTGEFQSPTPSPVSTPTAPDMPSPETPATPSPADPAAGSATAQPTRPTTTPATPNIGAAASGVAETALESVIARARGQLENFAAETMAEITATQPMLAPSDRQAVNLYLAGAAQTAADRNVFDAVTTVALVRHILERSGLSPADTDTFLTELEGEAERPRFRRMIEGGAAALAARIDDPTAQPSPSITDLLAAWNDPSGQGAEPQQNTFLLTDIVGSTALTSQIGNAGAQRVVRAHNAIVRAAAKAFKGREVKHTGDGMLLVFPDPTAGARAAMDIQQEATNYAQDNPSAPLVLRVGVHTGDAVLEDGEYYGSAISIVNGVCAVVDGGEICCTVAIRRKVASSAFRFEDLGMRTLKGSATGIEVLKLLWEPKRSAGPGVLEYRQIGTAPPAT